MTPLQKRILSLIAEDPSIRASVYLGGGSLAAERFLDGHRQSFDLDLFAKEEGTSTHRLAERVRDLLAAGGLSCRFERRGEFVNRLHVEEPGGGVSVLVDIVNPYEQVVRRFSPGESGLEEETPEAFACQKLLAAQGRKTWRDLADLAALWRKRRDLLEGAVEILMGQERLDVRRLAERLAIREEGEREEHQAMAPAMGFEEAGASLLELHDFLWEFSRRA